MVGLEAAIVLIAFVIIAAAFAFMVINQGLFATERGKTTIQEGIKQASTPLSLDGTILVRTDSTGTRVNVIIIPLRAFGVKYVAIWRNQTVTAAVLAISNSNGDESLDSFEKGYLIITLSPSDAAHVRDSVTVEIRLEKTAPLSIEFNIPESMPQDTYMPISG